MDAKQLKGIRKAPFITVGFAAVATPAAIWQVSIGRTAVIKKLLMSSNGTAGNATVQIGTGLGGLFVANIFNILVIGTANPTILTAAEIPGIRYDVDITATILAVTGVIGAAPNNVTIAIEVAELG